MCEGMCTCVGEGARERSRQLRCSTVLGTSGKLENTFICNIKDGTEKRKVSDITDRILNCPNFLQDNLKSIPKFKACMPERNHFYV